VTAYTVLAYRRAVKLKQATCLLFRIFSLRLTRYPLLRIRFILLSQLLSLNAF